MLSKTDKKPNRGVSAGDELIVPVEQLAPCIAARWSFVDARHMHTCTLDNDHALDHPDDGHACPCGWFWHD